MNNDLLKMILYVQKFEYNPVGRLSLQLWLITVIYLFVDFHRSLKNSTRESVTPKVGWSQLCAAGTLPAHVHADT